MHVLQPELAEQFALAVRFREMNGGSDDLPEFQVAHVITNAAQTLLFSADQALALSPALEELAERVEYRLPFQDLILQFDRPIPESTFFVVERPSQQPDDAILALLLHQHEDDRGVHNQAVAYFSSTAINRVYWRGADFHFLPSSHLDDVGLRNKQMLRNLAVGCIAYVNCINMELRQHKPEAKVNRKRAAKGKRLLQPYYTVELKPQYRDAGSRGNGAKHGHIYDVRGHFRRLPDSRLTWVRAHQRGLTNGVYIPSVKRVR